MARVPGFWVGAVEHGRGLDLDELAERVGGLYELVSGGADALVAAGLPPVRARAWASEPDRQTMGRVITLDDPRYPLRLREIPHAPPALFVEGDLQALAGEWQLAVVGTRRCTSYGSSVARHLGGALAAAGAVVVSGLARGIDGYAHRAAVEVGRTLAVLGHGLGHTAPASHTRLRRRIVREGGAVLSTWLDSRAPRPFRFPVRNRWIAGLSDATIVVEAGARSGASITAREALELGRDVYAVPGPIGAPASVGCLRLIDQGAGVVRDVDALVAELVRPAPLSRDEAWLRALFAGSTVDEVARRVGRSVADLLAELADMELRGQVVRLPGQRYAPGGSLR